MVPKLSHFWTTARLRLAILLLEAGCALAQQAVRRGRHGPVSGHERRTLLKVGAALRWLSLRVSGRLSRSRRKK